MSDQSDWTTLRNGINDPNFVDVAANRIANKIHEALRFDDEMTRFDDYKMQTYFNPQFAHLRRSQDVARVARAGYEEIDGDIDLRSKDGRPTGAETMSKILATQKVKETLPELAFVELQYHYDRIHSESNGKGIMLSELKAYQARTDIPDFEKLGLGFAIDNFDAISKLDPSGGNRISGKAVYKGLEYYGGLETEKTELKVPLDLASGLSVLDKHFGEIPNNAATMGISKVDLENFSHTKNTLSDAEQSDLHTVSFNYEKATTFNSADGDRLFYTAWLSRGNADGLTKDDISSGLAMAKENPKRIAEIDDLVKQLPK